MLWNTATGKRITTTFNQGGLIGDVAFSSDGKILAVGDDTGGVILRNLATGRRTATLTLPYGCITVAFSRAGFLMAGDALGGISIWNASTGHQFATPAEASNGSQTWAYALSPDSQLIAAARVVGGISLLRENLGNLSLGHFERLICGEIQGNLTRGEWARYALGQPYQKTCPAYP